MAELEKALIEFPSYPSIAANLDSAVRIRQKLEAQFAEAARRLASRFAAIVRLMTTTGQCLRRIRCASRQFQRLVSVVFGSKKYGKKQRARVDSDLEKETALGLGYAFTGSIGVVLTIRGDTNLFGESYLDDTMHDVFGMAKASDTTAIKQYASNLGTGAINALYSWDTPTQIMDLGRIAWHRSDAVKERAFLSSGKNFRVSPRPSSG